MTEIEDRCSGDGPKCIYLTKGGLELRKRFKKSAEVIVQRGNEPVLRIIKEDNLEVSLSLEGLNIGLLPILDGIPLTG